MTNLTPTPITDKNGKQTTVHKKAEGATGTTRVAALGRTVEKRTPFKPGTYDSPKWKSTDAVELGAKDTNGDQSIVFNGRVIGSVSSATETSTHKIAGTRLSRSGAKETTWRAGTHKAERGDMVGDSSAYGYPTRTKVVTEYVNSFLDNKVKKAENKAFIDNGGISFVDSGTSQHKEFSVNGKVLELPEGFEYKNSSTYPIGQFELRTDISVTSGSFTAIISPNDIYEPFDDEFPMVQMRNTRDFKNGYALINNDGSLTPATEGDVKFFDANKASVDATESLTKQIIAARY